jgi:hypothetical protein
VRRFSGIRNQSVETKIKDGLTAYFFLVFPFILSPHCSSVAFEPPSAGHPVRAALLRTAIQYSVFPCDPVNTSRYVVWRLCCFTLKWNDGNCYGEADSCSPD